MINARALLLLSYFIGRFCAFDIAQLIGIALLTYSWDYSNMRLELD